MNQLQLKDDLRSFGDDLPERVFTRSGSSFDPRSPRWEWFDGPYLVQINFRRLPRDFKVLLVGLKRVLIHVAKGHSGSYVRTLSFAFRRFAFNVQRCPSGVISVESIISYQRAAPVQPRNAIGVISRLLRMWVDLGIPGVDPACIPYLDSLRVLNYKKGRAVLTRDPVKGPFSEEEYKSLYMSVNAAHGRGDIDLWILVLTRLLFACGGRVSQYISLKISDFDLAGQKISLPTAKTGLGHTRCAFIDFDLSAQTCMYLGQYIVLLKSEGHGSNSALFPWEHVRVRRSESRSSKKSSSMFFGHCSAGMLAERYVNAINGLALSTSRLNNESLPVTLRRFRYTFGTRLAEEGASKLIIANRLGHVDLQHVDCYISSSPRIVERLDHAIGELLSPLAKAFQGQLVENGAPGASAESSERQIIDFRVSTSPVGNCSQSASGCVFNKPVCCYTCIRFEPWLDAPHHEVRKRLMLDREKFGTDFRMAAVNDEAIKAIDEVIFLCEQVAKQRADRCG